MSTTEEKMSKKQVWIYGLSIIVASIGAINWGTIGCCDYNFVSALLPNSKARNILYIIVGIAGLLAAFSAIRWIMKKGTGENEYYNPVYGYFGSQYYNDGTRNVSDEGGSYASLKGYYSAMA